MQKMWRVLQMTINKKPWECPRCRSWMSPSALKCDCPPVKRDYCTKCLTDAFSIFDPPFPSLDIIHAYAEDFHKNYAHKMANEKKGD